MSHITGAAQTLRDYLSGHEFEYAEGPEAVFTFSLPGEQKLQTPVRIEVGEHAVAIRAFVCRNPDENHAAVHRWLLARNQKMLGTAFAVDVRGDIFLDSRLPLSTVNTEDLDVILGAVMTHSDESFNTLLELGFASSIRQEWEWRLSRGEPTHNLEAFRGWLESGEEPTPADP